MIPSEETRKLKRGLKDISELFRVAEVIHSTEQEERQHLQILSAVCPDAPSLSSSLNTWLASRWASPQRKIPVVHLQHQKTYSEHQTVIHPSAGLKLQKHAWFSYDDFFRFDRPTASEAGFDFYSPLLLLSMDHLWEKNPAKIYGLIDKLVIYVRPLLRGITESYKLIKSAFLHNRDIECFLLFDGGDEDARGRKIFETMNQMVASSLGTNLNWLGNVKFVEIMEGEIARQSSLDELLLQGDSKILSPEKIEIEKFLFKHAETDILPIP